MVAINQELFHWEATKKTIVRCRASLAAFALHLARLEVVLHHSLHFLEVLECLAVDLVDFQHVWQI